MKKTVWDLIKLCFPLGAEKRRAFNMASPYLSDNEHRRLKQYLKLDRTFPIIQRFHTTPALFEDKEWPFFKSHLQDESLHTFLAAINEDIAHKAKQEAFLAFAPHALSRIMREIAPNIVGMDDVKHASALILFSKEPFHLLLIGDPGTGKTDVLRSIHTLSAISSFGLGSGTSGAGLGAAAKGDEIIKGLLPMADGGIACIDELNLMKSKDMAALYNAMEKGFVTFDKGTKHEQLSARVRVCATANPSGDVFVGRSAEMLRRQIMFDDALLSRFHFIFIVRKPTDKEFEEITKNIVKQTKRTLPKEDAQFIKEYIAHAMTIDVAIDPRMEQAIVASIKELKEDERQFLMEISPRAVVGAVRIVKAVARAELSQQVDKDHVATAFMLLRKALYVRKPDQPVVRDKRDDFEQTARASRSSYARNESRAQRAPLDKNTRPLHDEVADADDRDDDADVAADDDEETTLGDDGKDGADDEQQRRSSDR